MKITTYKNVESEVRKMRTIHTEKYYTSMKHLLDVFDREARKMGMQAENIEEFEKWKKNVRDKLRDITGINKMEM